MALAVCFTPPSTGNTYRIPYASLSKSHFCVNSLPLLHSQVQTARISAARSNRMCFPVVKATGEENTEGAVSETESDSGKKSRSEEGGSEAEMSELGAEIKKAMMERKEKEGELSFGGVAEEVREIEWPAFRKVIGTTGVVLGVIAGSSVVLLTVNVVLAELSDKVFVGKGVQDFFS